jgi:hypothetical protein
MNEEATIKGALKGRDEINPAQAGVLHLTLASVVYTT